MSNIIPQYINDKLNDMFEYIKNLYKAFVSFTQNFYVDSDKNIVINGNSVKINTNNIDIFNSDSSGNININGNSILLNSDTGNINISNNEIMLTNNSLNNQTNINLDRSGNMNIKADNLIYTSSKGVIQFNSIVKDKPSFLGNIVLRQMPPSTTSNIGTIWIDFSKGNMYIYTQSGWQKIVTESYTPTN